MNTAPRNNRRTLLASLAGMMMLAGIAHAADRSTDRPSAAAAGRSSIHEAQYGHASARVDKFQLATADRDHQELPSFGRRSGPGSANAGRNNAGPPSAQTGANQASSDPFGTAIADRDDASLPAYGRAARPNSDTAGRGNADLPQAIVQAGAELSGPCIGDAADRDNAPLPEAALLDAMLRDLMDPFGFETDEADRDEPANDDVWPSCDPMDLDADGDVDFDDFRVLSAAFGTEEGDLDGDGIVTGADLGLMLIRFTTALAND